MRKLLLILIAIFMLTGCTGDDISDQSTPEPTETTITEPTTTEDTTSIAGTYIETYKDAIPEDWKRKNEAAFSRLILNEDGSCLFIYNNCDAMYLISPTYEVVDDKIIISDIDFNNPHWKFFKDYVHPVKKSDSNDIVIDDDEDITFTIVSDDEIYPNFEIGCIYGYEDYQKGYTSFIKEK